MLRNLRETVKREWERSGVPLEKMYERIGALHSRVELPPVTFRIFDLEGEPIACRICERDDRWFIEGNTKLSEILSLRVFVCEHNPVELFQETIRNIDTVKVARVSRYEVVRN